ncbi:MAG: lipoyl protein ligase domain-containing protein [Bdellovibrionota bacterium]
MNSSASGFFAFRAGYDYEEALRFQGILNSEGYTGLLAFEPPETITFGNMSKPQDLLVSHAFLRKRGVRLLSTDRGGRTAYHGPGQLVGFPVANLHKLYGDARAVKRFSEELLLGLAHAVAVLGVRSVEARSDVPGLWTNGRKLASVGINVKDGYVFHGFTINITQDCIPGHSLVDHGGGADCPVTSLEAEGIRVEGARELATRILPYLSVIHGEAVYKESKSVSYETAYANLVSAVSRSQMAIDHFRNNLENSGTHD